MKLGKFGIGSYKEHLCEIILNLDQWFKRCHVKIFLIYSSDGHLVPPSESFKQFC